MNDSPLGSAFPSTVPVLPGLRSRLMLSICILMGLGFTPLARVDAQSVAATARLHVVPVMAIRDVAPPVERSRNARAIEVVERVTVASNADYVIHALPLARLAELHRAGIRVSVRQADGSYVPVASGSRIPVARGVRGGESVTTVVLRFEGAGTRTARDLVRAFALQVVVEGPSGGLFTTEPTVVGG